jgi:hypothetical protein
LESRKLPTFEVDSKTNPLFEMNTNNSTLLVAAAFAMIGFILGRVTAPHPPMTGGHFEVLKHIGEGGVSAMGGDGEVQVIVKSLDEGDFEGDTVFAIPGGHVHMIKSGDEVEVEVEMSETSVNEWVEKGEDGVVVKKRIVVTSED